MSFRNEDEAEMYRDRGGFDESHIHTFIDDRDPLDIAPPSADMHDCTVCYRSLAREVVMVCLTCGSAMCRACHARMVSRRVGEIIESLALGFQMMTFEDWIAERAKKGGNGN
jgi:hypothetical protein